MEGRQQFVEDGTTTRPSFWTLTFIPLLPRWCLLFKTSTFVVAPSYTHTFVRVNLGWTFPYLFPHSFVYCHLLPHSLLIPPGLVDRRYFVCCIIMHYLLLFRKGRALYCPPPSFPFIYSPSYGHCCYLVVVVCCCCSPYLWFAHSPFIWPFVIVVGYIYPSTSHLFTSHTLGQNQTNRFHVITSGQGEFDFILLLTSFVVRSLHLLWNRSDHLHRSALSFWLHFVCWRCCCCPCCPLPHHHLFPSTSTLRYDPIRIPVFTLSAVWLRYLLLLTLPHFHTVRSLLHLFHTCLPDTIVVTSFYICLHLHVLFAPTLPIAYRYLPLCAFRTHTYIHHLHVHSHYTFGTVGWMEQEGQDRFCILCPHLHFCVRYPSFHTHTHTCLFIASTPHLQSSPHLLFVILHSFCLSHFVPILHSFITSPLPSCYVVIISFR